MIILTLKETARQDGVSLRHLQRLIATGEGPPTVELGPRRVGVIEADNQRWVMSRRRVPPGFKEDERQ
jgi:predicted DNA-binding transcriptional regulator AlpA